MCFADGSPQVRHGPKNFNLAHLITPPNAVPCDWWSLQPLRRPVLNTPELLSSEPPPHSPADVLIREKLAEHTLAVSPLAVRRTLLRVTLDLVGFTAVRRRRFTNLPRISVRMPSKNK